MSGVTAAAKPAKERKSKAAPKEKKSKTASHPTYFEMIVEALLALNEKSGSSPYAIAKYMEEKHKAVLSANFRKMLGLQLKNSAAKGKLIKVKASYKLSEAERKGKAVALKIAPAVDKKPRAARATAAAAVGSKRKAEAVKKATPKKAKKATPVKAKAKAKQPKSIKSPGAKKAKKGV